MKTAPTIALLTVFLLSFIVSCQGRHHHPEGMDMNHDFSNAEEWAQRFNNPERDAWQKPEEIVQLMELQPGRNVVDIGAGTGYFLPYLHKAVAPNGVVLALDIEESLVNYMRELAKKENLTTVEANVIHPSDPALVKDSVERILIANTWHHIADRKTYAQKLLKALKQDGKLFIVDYVPGAEGPGPADKHRMQAKDVGKELESAGFKSQILEESLPYQYVVLGTR